MSDGLLGELKSLLGETGVFEGARAREAAHSNWSRLGAPRAVIRPSSTDDVSRVLALCNSARQPIVPWGGKTGLVEGGNADGAFALSLDRMNCIESPGSKLVGDLL